MRPSILAACAAVAAFLVSACQTPIVDETGPLSIQSVTVTARPTVKSVTDLAPPVQTAATRALVGGDPAGTKTDVSISIDQVTYKDPLMSFLVGSMNSLMTTVTLRDGSGAVLASFQHVTMLDAAINGVMGAAIAASQDKLDTDRRLVEAFEPQIKRRIYGPEGHKPKVAAPVAKPANPAPVAAAPAAPAATPAGPERMPAAVPTS